MNSSKKETRGRKSNESKGIEPTIVTSIRMQRSIIDLAIEKHGSLSKAIEFAAKA